MYAPSCGQCDGYFYLISNCPSNIAYINLSFHNLVDSLGQGYYLDDLCPDRWYYISIKVSADFCQDYFIQDSFYVSHAAYCSTVYPGDANNDGVANNLDLLAIGIAYADTGAARIDTTITWDAKYGKDWQNVFADSTNHKHADSNGNGIVNYDDTLAIIQNYGFTHQRPGLSNLLYPGAPVLFIDLPDSLSPLTTYTAPVYLGDSTISANNIYGISFSIVYPTPLIIPTSIQWITDSSWVGNTNSDLIAIQHNNLSGLLDIGISRIDHTNRNGNGIIGTLQFKAMIIF